MEPSDEALILACRRGDAFAWETLSTRYRGLIYNVARRVGLDQEQAADVSQNVFAILVRKLDGIEQPAHIGAWLTTTTRHEAWKLRQRERASGMIVSYDAPEVNALPEESLLPDEQLLRLEEQHKVDMAVAALDERCRKLLTLLFYRPDPAPYAEVAATLRIPEGSIGPLRGRCLRKLRGILNGMEF
ncbi:MAG TPA: sigma-70 family RNA polymerase sigma factor [Roseiflexaceae bacterium]|nr:sigma-70 family RNA polymerase sigma factor [Roseiflexaceae bacterium]